LGGVNRGPHGGDSTGIGIRRLTGFGKAQWKCVLLLLERTAKAKTNTWCYVQETDKTNWS
jgi:hypothetical protein